jgi:uncharacterized membrane protein
MHGDETTTPSRMRAPANMREVITRLEDDAGLDRVADRLRPAVERLPARVADALAGEWLGHASHPLLTDVPIGCWIATSVLDVVGGRGSRRAAQRLVAAGLLAVPLTVAAGLVDWSRSSDARVRRVGVAHAGGNVAVAALYLGSWLARRRDRHVIGVVAALAGGGVAAGTGYLGGHLAFARGAGVGPRGLDAETDDRTGDPASDGTDDELVDAQGAMTMLGIRREQLDAMVADDLLVARAVVADEPRFARADLMAVRLVGG